MESVSGLRGGERLSVCDVVFRKLRFLIWIAKFWNRSLLTTELMFKKGIPQFCYERLGEEQNSENMAEGAP